VTVPDDGAIEAAVDLMRDAERPVFYVGGGVIKANGSEALRHLVELTGIPVVTTLMARGAFPDSHPRCLGMPGMHGTYTAVTAMQRSDLLIALGARFDDRVTGKLDGFAPDAKVIHVDIDRAELGKVRRPDVAILADCRLAIEALSEAFDRRSDVPGGDRIGPWLALLDEWRRASPSSMTRRQRSRSTRCAAAAD